MLLVQCDFDDTISVGNVSSAIREAFGNDDWRPIDEGYQAGRYSVEESNIRQFALIRVPKKELSEFVSTDVVVREGFEEFVEYCNASQIRLVIVSSGLDIYIVPTLKRLGLEHLEMHSAKADVTPSGIGVSYTDPSGAPLTQGFKESFTREFKKNGHTVVYVGDGRSDIVPAGEADFAIARSFLERHLKANGVPYYGFETFADVRAHVEEIRQFVPEANA